MRKIYFKLKLKSLLKNINITNVFKLLDAEEYIDIIPINDFKEIKGDNNINNIYKLNFEKVILRDHGRLLIFFKGFYIDLSKNNIKLYINKNKDFFTIGIKTYEIDNKIYHSRESYYILDEVYEIYNGDKLINGVWTEDIYNDIKCFFSEVKFIFSTLKCIEIKKDKELRDLNKIAENIIKEETLKKQKEYNDSWK